MLLITLMMHQKSNSAPLMQIQIDKQMHFFILTPCLMIKHTLIYLGRSLIPAQTYKILEKWISFCDSYLRIDAILLRDPQTATKQASLLPAYLNSPRRSLQQCLKTSRGLQQSLKNTVVESLQPWVVGSPRVWLAICHRHLRRSLAHAGNTG